MIHRTKNASLSGRQALLLAMAAGLLASVSVGAPGLNAQTVNLAVVPSNAAVLAGGTQQFSTSPAGVPVTWSVVGDGTIDTNGLYHAPGEVSGVDSSLVEATAGDGSGRSASTLVFVVPPPPPPPPGQPGTGVQSAVLTVADVSGAAGSQVAIPVQVDAGAQNLAGAQFSLQAGNALSFTGASAATAGALIAGPSVTTTAQVATDGTLQVTVSGGAGVNGPGILVNLTGTIPAGTQPGSYPLTFTAAKLTNASGNAIPSETLGGTLTVVKPAADITISVRNASGLPGATVPIEIDADTGSQGVRSAGLTLQFGNVGTAGVAGVTAGPLLGGGSATVLPNDRVFGQVSVSLANTVSNSGQGALATIPFTISSTAAPGVYPLTLLHASLSNIGTVSYTVQFVSGTLTVLGSGGRLRGDANGDGRVNVADATVALRFAVGIVTPTPDQVAALDFNGDGRVDVGDVTRLLRYVVGISPTL